MQQDIAQLKIDCIKLSSSLACMIVAPNQIRIEKVNLFKTLLSKFDWFYEYSDSFDNQSNYWEGSKIHSEILKMKEGDEELTKLYDEANPFNR